MKKMNLYAIILTSMIGIIYIFYTVNSDRANNCNVCDIKNYSIQSDDNNDRIIIGCAGNSEALRLSVIDPYTMEIDKVIVIDGLLENAVGLANGNEILALLSEVDGFEDTHDGKLIKINYNTGEYICEFAIQDRMPLAMVTDSQQNYVYITAGFMIEYEDTPPKLFKLSVADLSLISSATIGEMAENIVLTTDDSKLYIDDGGVQIRYDFDGYRASNTEYYYEISVFQASNLDKLTTIELNTPPSKMLMGYDNRLFATFCCPEVYNDVTLVIIDTNTDQIISSMVFGSDDKTGINYMACDPYSHTLYCTTYEYGTWDPELEAEVHSPSSKILSIDLDDYSHEFISTGIDKLWQIAAVSTPTSCRLFCTCDSDDRKIIYIDP